MSDPCPSSGNPPLPSFQHLDHVHPHLSTVRLQGNNPRTHVLLQRLGLLFGAVIHSGRLRDLGCDKKNAVPTKRTLRNRDLPRSISANQNPIFSQITQGYNKHNEPQPRNMRKPTTKKGTRNNPKSKDQRRKEKGERRKEKGKKRDRRKRKREREKEKEKE